MSDRIEEDAKDNRVAVGCIALVGASGVESVPCKNCNGSGWIVRYSDLRMSAHSMQCLDCDGTGRIERIAPTISRQESPAGEDQP